MSTARFLVGDVHERLTEIPDGSVDLVLTSPPFLALRSYLPADHPAKDREIGSEATPAEFLETLLALTAEWGRVLAPHGSIAVELGDTYAGSGGSGGDYDPGGMREGQRRWQGSGAVARTTLADGRRSHSPWKGERAGWPLDKSLCGIPTLYAWSLAYGRNLLTGEESPAGMWRVRNVKPWIRTNPPVGSLGDKERPATSYVIVATRARDRWFDLDAVRVRPQGQVRLNGNGPKAAADDRGDGKGAESPHFNDRVDSNAAGAPPLDWWHEVDAIIDAEIDQRAGKTAQGGGAGPGRSTKLHGGAEGTAPIDKASTTVGARGVHIRRTLERAGFLSTAEALDVTAKGYSGAHYAVWPPELCRLLIEEMCPRRACTTCGRPSRRITEKERPAEKDDRQRRKHANGQRPADGRQDRAPEVGWEIVSTTTGWSSCGCPSTDGIRLDGFHTGAGWRPGVVLDPFAGSGTTLLVAHSHGRDSIGIDLDERNADLARERLGMFVDVDQPDPQPEELV